MPDPADVAQEAMEKSGIGYLALPKGPSPVGKCRNCDGPVGKGELFCDADCRDDWTKRHRRQ